MDFKDLRKRQKQEKAKKEKKMLKWYKSGKPPSSLNELGFSILAERVGRPRIVTCPQGVVSYTLGNARVGNVLRHLASADEIDAKIREILAITPHITLAKLKKFGEDMGISINKFEKPAPAPAAPPKDDVLF